MGFRGFHARLVAAIGSLAVFGTSLVLTGWWQAAQAVAPIPAVGISAGASHTMIVRSDGAVIAFGYNAEGQLGMFPAAGINRSPSPTRVPGLSGMTAVSAGANHTLTLGSDGKVWGFGQTGFGQVGHQIWTFAVISNPTPIPVTGLINIVAIAAGGTHSLALRSDGALFAFGSNAFGQLGSSTNSGTTRSNPTPLFASMSNVVAVAAGRAHTLALRNDGTVWSFGENNVGQLGHSANNGNTNANPTPVQVPGLTNITAIAAGGDVSVALRGDGTVWAFGENTFGQLGRDTGRASSPVATQVAGLTAVTGIATSGGHTLAVRTDGTVWAFGSNSLGELGTPPNNGTLQPTPMQVPGLTGVVKIAAGSFIYGPADRPFSVGFSLALRSNGEVWAFGSNGDGQLGGAFAMGNGANPTPRRIPGLNKPVAGAVVKVHVSDVANATVFGNLTVDQPDGGGYTTAYPCADGRPNSSNSNYVSGQTIPNFAAVRADANGDVCFYTTASANLIWDQVATTTAITATNAARLLDTRFGEKPVAGAVVKVHVSDVANTTVFGNLTVDQPVGGGYTTAFACADGRPDSSNSNYVSGQTIPNFAAVRADANGDVCFYTTASAHLIWDQVATTTAITATNATRLLDTRGGLKPVNGEIVRVHVADTANATVFGNLTVDQPVGGGYTTAFPCADGRPDSSNSNYVSGQTIPNFAAVRADVNGDICFYTTASAHLIWDQVATTAAITATNTTRLLDTRE